MATLTRVVLLTTSVIAVGSVACTVGETRYETVHLPPTVKPSAIRTCDSPIVNPDKGSLKACGDGKGHCFDETKLPVGKDQLAVCDDPTTVCVPDKVLFGGGVKLKSCKFFLDGRPGACVSTMLKQVGDNKDLLQQDACDPDERCLPCIDPRDNSDTHLCTDGAVGPHESACVGGPASALAPCCHGMGVCLDEGGVPADQRSNMSRDQCKEGKLCSPASITNNKPVTCSVGPLSGICMDLCFASMFQATTQVTRSNCGPTETCLPCALANMSGMSVPGCM
jgi:hypothetical protein